ncbi:MAG: diguanylate cyclase [Lachnospiraceae bacterium]|nr:diguanylate cyclase [Lachnospiraceae bacterium]
MYYSAIGILALLILLIENQDILLNRNNVAKISTWKVYRGFLYAVIVYYVTDILWGLLEHFKKAKLLFADTSVYYIAMAAGIVFWSHYVITYLDERDGFGRFFVYAGRILSLMVTICAFINIFIPVIFKIDEDCVYHTKPLRDILLLLQIILLVTLSANSTLTMRRRNLPELLQRRYRTVSTFGVLMAVLLLLQFWFPYLPLYSVAYMLGTCLLRAVVIGSEKEEMRVGIIEADKIRELQKSISSLLDNMPALSFSKDAVTGIYLACNQAFAEYAHKENPDGVIGLTDAEIFDAETARHFVDDDKMALSMDEPYIFYEDVPDAAGNQRQFQTTKLKFIDSVGRLCTLGMCQDVTDMVRIQHEQATTKEAYERARTNEIILSHISQTLTHGYADLFYINVVTGDYIEYKTNDTSDSLKEVRRGNDFFVSCKDEAEQFIYEEDRQKFVDSMKKDFLTDTLEKNKSFVMTYRLLSENGPIYVSMKVSKVDDDENCIIIGVNDINEEMKQRQAAERIQEERTVYRRINALVGDFICVYLIDPESDRFWELSASEDYNRFMLPKEGTDFFDTSSEYLRKVVYHSDLTHFVSVFAKEKILEEISKNGIFAINYRMVADNIPRYVQLKAAMIDEKEGKRLIIGINDIDNLVRQEQEYQKRLSLAENQAHIDALTGVRNKHAYLDEEEKLDSMINEGNDIDFAIVIFDVNDLKKVNDSQGHQAGDQYIRDACKLICDTFKRSPVFRVGGDEFAVVAQGEDYAVIDELIDRVANHNKEASENGGIVIACGMSRFEKEDDCVAKVFERADRKMYEGKNILKNGN